MRGKGEHGEIWREIKKGRNDVNIVVVYEILKAISRNFGKLYKDFIQKSKERDVFI